MRLIWVIATHQFEYPKEIFLNLLRHSALHYADQFLFVRVDIWWKPKSCSGEAVNVVRAFVCECFATKSPYEAWEMHVVLLRIMPYPLGNRIRAKCPY